MAHYALLDGDSIVTQVITGKDETDTDSLPEGFDSWEDYYLTKFPDASLCKRTSYNTRGNVHADGGTAFRGNYAGIGYFYDVTNDVFYEQDPGDGSSLNNSTWLWE